MKFKIRARKISYETYEVEADSAVDAVLEFRDGNGGPILNSEDIAEIDYTDVYRGNKIVLRNPHFMWRGGSSKWLQKKNQPE